MPVLINGRRTRISPIPKRPTMRPGQRYDGIDVMVQFVITIHTVAINADAGGSRLRAAGGSAGAGRARGASGSAGGGSACAGGGSRLRAAGGTAGAGRVAAVVSVLLVAALGLDALAVRSVLAV